jgi:DNA repair protein SbcD/Mre11
MVKFAHIADVHLGGWRNDTLKELSDQTFTKAIDICIEKRVDFVLIAGDLFNTSLPGVERIKKTIEKFRELKENNIPLYYIAGSHDFSPSGKTMLDVIEKAGLGINVAKGSVDDAGRLNLKFTQDPKTIVKMTGVIGKRGMLDKSYYEALNLEPLEAETGFKIFLLHTALSELKPPGYENMESSPVSFLPKDFDYYAAGHVHVRQVKDLENYGTIVYPGPLFPNNFKELEQGLGGFYIYDGGKEGTDKLEFIPVHLAQTFTTNIDCTDRTPEQVEQDLKDRLYNRDLSNTIVLVRMKGTLLKGKPSDINLQNIMHDLVQSQKALVVLKNTSKLLSRDFEEVKVSTSSIDEMEDKLVEEQIDQPQYSEIEEKKLIPQLMRVFVSQKKEGEVSNDFEDRIKRDADSVMEF